MGEEREKDEFKDEKERAEKILIHAKKKKKRRKNEVARAFALITQLGIQMVFCVAIGVVTGIFLDRWIGTAPLFIIIFSLLGSAASVKVIYDISKDWND